MKSITIKETINTGNYENLVLEISIDRPSGMDLNSFLEMAKYQMKLTKEKLLK